MDSEAYLSMVESRKNSSYAPGKSLQVLLCFHKSVTGSSFTAIVMFVNRSMSSADGSSLPP